MRTVDAILKDYRAFLSDVSEEAARLTEIYREYMVCKKGCSQCCTDLTLLPLEWFALDKVVQDEGLHPQPYVSEERCTMLDNDACMVYPYRPLICRTHGLPLLYLTQDYNDAGIRIKVDEPEWQISWCDLNFTDVSEETMEDIFDPEDVLNMEEWNLILGKLNREFLKTPEGKALGKNRIPLKNISAS
ncbi:MAG: hypothetical protein B6241_08590 [Spirochaetaceae bacterium 4572_59]|nr:MAG: hypothetical protein B6241_08590 [Spirochaetaceae bacterium 4572_59]